MPTLQTLFVALLALLCLSPSSEVEARVLHVALGHVAVGTLELGAATAPAQPPKEVADAVAKGFAACNALPASQTCDPVANTTAVVSGGAMHAPGSTARRPAGAAICACKLRAMADDLPAYACRKSLTPPVRPLPGCPSAPPAPPPAARWWAAARPLPRRRRAALP